ncbi:MAG TPA: trehalose-6-phosphate synthase [Gammaproteobacteria bacterium]
MSRLVAVSNRVALPKRGRPAGGLAVGLLSALNTHGGVWFGWSGKTCEGESSEVKTTASGKITFATFDINEQEYDAYYNGFSNNTLWPLFHSLLGFFSYSRDHYDAYLRVNALFARRLLPLLQPDDIVWVHDYHLLPLAAELRRAGARQPIGFFLHVPFPSYDVLRALPRYDEILRALAVYDVVGVQTRRDLWALQDCFSKPEYDAIVNADGTIDAFGRRFRTGSFPIGIEVDACRALAEQNLSHPQVAKLAARLGRRKLMIGVDRLDYSKGLVLRFRAVESLLANYPAHRGEVVFMQIAPPTRTGVRTYREIRQELEQVSGHVNGLYADIDWTPIRYLNRSYDRGVIMALFRIARVGLTTPIRDGMNLVAKEYLASQDPDDPGVLVLSKLAGAAEELDAAVLVNPYDQQGVADAIARALEMPLAERRTRHRELLACLERNDVHNWSRSFLAALEGTRQDPGVRNRLARAGRA